MVGESFRVVVSSSPADAKGAFSQSVCGPVGGLDRYWTGLAIWFWEGSKVLEA